MLNEELKHLEVEEEGLVTSILHGENIVREKDILVTNAENELSNLELIQPLSIDDIATLQTMDKILTEAREELKTLKWAS